MRIRTGLIFVLAMAVPVSATAVTRTFTFSGTSSNVLCEDEPCNRFIVRLGSVGDNSINRQIDGLFKVVRKGEGRVKRTDCTWPNGGPITLEVDLGAFADKDDRGTVVLQSIRERMENGKIVRCYGFRNEDISGVSPDNIVTGFDNKGYYDLVTVVRESDFDMDGSKVVPPNGSHALGNGIIEVDVVTNHLKFDITVTGLISETGAQIRGPAQVGATSAVLFDMPLGSHKVGTWNYPEGLEQDILDGLTYVSIETLANPSGEIRGQIQAFEPTVPVPASPIRVVVGIGLLLAVTAIAFVSGRVSFEHRPLSA
jgi:hypothetical protein